MKKIINGIKYDTETAEFLASDNYIDYWEDGYVDYQESRSEELYRKKNGEYFLYSQGSYNCPEIVPFSEKEARKWSKKYLDADEYEKIFGKVFENGLWQEQTQGKESEITK